MLLKQNVDVNSTTHGEDTETNIPTPAAGYTADIPTIESITHQNMSDPITKAARDGNTTDTAHRTTTDGVNSIATAVDVVNSTATAIDVVNSTATAEHTTDTIKPTTHQVTSERSVNQTTQFPPPKDLTTSTQFTNFTSDADISNADSAVPSGKLIGVGFVTLGIFCVIILITVLLIRKFRRNGNGREPGTFNERINLHRYKEYRKVADSDDNVSDEESGRSKGKNVKFYKNEQKSKPDGWYIEEMLQKLQGNNQKLEDNHGYVQWLFPNKEKGVNWQADPITDAELRDIKSDPFCRERFVRAYEMMLQFYGIDLVDREIGTLRIRQDYTERCDNMQRHTHNYLRITRIIKALGLFGFEQYQETLIYHLVDAVKTGELSEPGAERSLKKHWIPSVCNPDLRDTLMNDN